MRCKWLFAVTLLSSRLYADVERQPVILPCSPSGTFSVLLLTNLVGGCTLEVKPGINILLENFNFVPAINMGDIFVSPSDVTYTTADPLQLGSTTAYGLDIKPGLSVSGNNTSEGIIMSFDVAPPSELSIDNSFVLSSTSTTGSGSAMVMQNTSKSGATLHVSDTATISSGAIRGTATATRVESLVSVKPEIVAEPGTIGLTSIGLGIIVLVNVRRRETKRS